MARKANSTLKTNMDSKARLCQKTGFGCRTNRFHDSFRIYPFMLINEPVMLFLLPIIEAVMQFNPLVDFCWRLAGLISQSVVCISLGDQLYWHEWHRLLACTKTHGNKYLIDHQECFNCSLKYFAWEASNEKAYFFFQKALCSEIQHCWKIQNCDWQIQKLITCINNVTPKSTLNDAICLFYVQTCTKQTLTNCLLAENRCGYNLPNKCHG